MAKIRTTNEKLRQEIKMYEQDVRNLNTSLNRVCNDFKLMKKKYDQKVIWCRWLWISNISLGAYFVTTIIQEFFK